MTASRCVPQVFVFRVSVHCSSFLRGRFIRHLRDKQSEQERSFGEELKRIGSAREVFQKVCICSTVPIGIACVLYLMQYIYIHIHVYVYVAGIGASQFASYPFFSSRSSRKTRKRHHYCSTALLVALGVDLVIPHASSSSAGTAVGVNNGCKPGQVEQEVRQICLSRARPRVPSRRSVPRNSRRKLLVYWKSDMPSQGTPTASPFVFHLPTRQKHFSITASTYIYIYIYIIY